MKCETQEEQDKQIAKLYGDGEAPTAVAERRLHAQKFAGRRKDKSGFQFGVSADEAAATLRELAEAIECGAILLQKAEVKSIASNDDFSSTFLTLEINERGPYKL